MAQSRSPHTPSSVMSFFGINHLSIWHATLAEGSPLSESQLTALCVNGQPTSSLSPTLNTLQASVLGNVLSTNPSTFSLPAPAVSSSFAASVGLLNKGPVTQSAVQAIVLCGPDETMRPLSAPDFPKCLLPVVSRPIIGHVLRWLEKQGVQDVVLVTLQRFAPRLTHYLMRQHESVSSNFHISYQLCILDERPQVLQQLDNAWQTCDALWAIRTRLTDRAAPVLIMSADVVCDLPLDRLLDLHRSKDATLTVTLAETGYGAQADAKLKKTENERTFPWSVVDPAKQALFGLDDGMSQLLFIAPNSKSVTPAGGITVSGRSVERGNITTMQPVVPPLSTGRLSHRKGKEGEVVGVPMRLLKRVPLINLRTDLADACMYIVQRQMLDWLRSPVEELSFVNAPSHDSVRRPPWRDWQCDVVPWCIREQVRAMGRRARAQCRGTPAPKVYSTHPFSPFRGDVLARLEDLYTPHQAAQECQQRIQERALLLESSLRRHSMGDSDKESDEAASNAPAAITLEENQLVPQQVVLDVGKVLNSSDNLASDTVPDEKTTHEQGPRWPSTRDVHCAAYVVREGLCARITTLAQYLEMNRRLVKNEARLSSHADIQSKAMVGNDVIVLDETRVEEKAVVKRSVLGAQCFVGAGSKLEGCVLLEGVRIEEQCRLENVLVGAGATIQARVTLKDCVVGANAVVQRDTHAQHETWSSVERNDAHDLDL